MKPTWLSSIGLQPSANTDTIDSYSWHWVASALSQHCQILAQTLSCLGILFANTCPRFVCFYAFVENTVLLKLWNKYLWWPCIVFVIMCSAQSDSAKFTIHISFKLVFQNVGALNCLPWQKAITESELCSLVISCTTVNIRIFFRNIYNIKESLNKWMPMFKGLSNFSACTNCKVPSSSATFQLAKKFIMNWKNFISCRASQI